MTCNVCVYQEGDTQPVFSNKTHVSSARKEVRCTECCEVILVGAPYWKIVGKWEGKLTTIRQCECCYEIQQVFCCDGWVYGELWEGMEEQAFPELKMAGECWDELSAASREFLLKKWREWKFDA